MRLHKPKGFPAVSAGFPDNPETPHTRAHWSCRVGEQAKLNRIRRSIDKAWQRVRERAVLNEL